MSWFKAGNIMGPPGPPGTGGGGGGTSMVHNEVPSGPLNGTNKAFTTAQTFVAGSLAVYLNGLRLNAPDDYTETSTTGFTMIQAPFASDRLKVDYALSGGTGGPSGPTPVLRETLAGVADGVNKVFTFNTAPTPTGSELIFLNGQLQEPGSTNDYTIVGTTVTFVRPPAAGSRVKANYTM